MTKKMCSHIHRVSVHPSVVIGGASLGECDRPALRGLTVCFDHVTKDALLLKLQQTEAELAECRRKLVNARMAVVALKRKAKE